MEIISLKGPHRIVRFPRGAGQLSRTRYEPFGGGGYWYRSETLLQGNSFGSTYSTLAEAERDFLETISAN